MKKLLIAFCLLMMSCDNPSDHPVDPRQKDADHLRGSLNYYYDDRTGLCFAGMWIGYYATSITSVTCNPDVLKFATHFRSKD